MSYYMSPNALSLNSRLKQLMPIEFLSFRLYPVYFCWLFMMVLTAAATYVHEHIQSPLVQSGVEGVFLGEFALAAIIGGLVGRTWIGGWLLSVCLAICATLICHCVDTCWPRYLTTSSESSRVVLCSFWPFLMLCACSPMIVMRGLRGWSLTLAEDIEIARRSSNVEDLFLLSVIVASCISIAKCMEELIPGFHLPQLFFIMGLFFSFSLFFVFPVVVITFRARNWNHRLLGWLGMTAVVMAACFGLAATLNSSFSIWQDLSYVAIGVSTAAVTMMVGVLALMFSGVKLTHFAPSSPLAEHQNDEASNQSTRNQDARIRGDRLQARILSGLVALSAVATVSVLNYFNFRMLAFYREVQSYSTRLPDLVSDLTIQGDNVVGLTFSPSTDDLSLERYRFSPKDRSAGSTLERVSLAGTRITDKAIEKLVYFPKLKHLDLSNTAISNAGLEKLTRIERLHSLSVANTKVDLAVALLVARKLGVTDLDVSGLGITDKELSDNLDFYSILSLNLSHNPVTDVGIAKLLENPKPLQKLNLSNTSVDGSGLISSNCPNALNLDSTKVTDANLIQILKMQTCFDLSIRSTGVTVAVLPSMAASGRLSLTLGEGNITEQDLANLPAGTFFPHLGLNDETFTGAFLQSGKIQLRSLDLSHSCVTDNALKAMVRMNWIPIDLSHTNITDAGLEVLSCQELDVRHTKVTAAGIRNARHVGRIFIDHNQFTPEELNSFRNSNVVIDGEKSGNGL